MRSAFSVASYAFFLASLIFLSASLFTSLTLESVDSRELSNDLA